MAVIIVDEFTGRLMIGRQWSDGLHQAVEAKHVREGVKIKEETQTLATDHAAELLPPLQEARRHDRHGDDRGGRVLEDLQARGRRPSRPTSRCTASTIPTRSIMSEKEKWDAVVREIERIHKFDVVHLNDGNELVGTIKSENENEIVLEVQGKPREADDQGGRYRRGRSQGPADPRRHDERREVGEAQADARPHAAIKHELLNAKPEYAGREAEIVAQAGRVGAVTIATNMAGRGTDIILGGNPETLAWARLKDKYATRLEVPDEEWKNTVAEIRAKENMEEEGREVAEMGGLHIIGTERHESRRIDNQLRGRAGRQGDPGSGRFYVSLQDDLMRIFGGEWVAERAAAAGHAGRRGDRERHGDAPHRGVPEEGRGAQLRHPQEPPRIRRGDGPPAQARLRLSPGNPQRRQLQDARLGHDGQADRPGPGPLSRSELRRRRASPSWCSSSFPSRCEASDFTRAHVRGGRPASRATSAHNMVPDADPRGDGREPR